MEHAFFSARARIIFWITYLALELVDCTEMVGRRMAVAA